MIDEVRYDESAAEFLRTHPRAEEARLFVEALRRGQAVPGALTDLDQYGRSLAVLPDSGHVIRWHYAGMRRNILVIDEIYE
ncbi:MAG TPA: hypothetical protein VNQ77_06385 [Frankiaceae bacterium]|nr:hypothetical protein [Frankiaceae bacterium]